MTVRGNRQGCGSAGNAGFNWRALELGLSVEDKGLKPQIFLNNGLFSSERVPMFKVLYFHGEVACETLILSVARD